MFPPMMLFLSAPDEVPFAGSVLGIVTAIAATVCAAGILGITIMIRRLRDDWIYIKGVVNGDPNRGELPLREELKQIKAQTKPESVKAATVEAVHQAHREEES